MREASDDLSRRSFLQHAGVAGLSSALLAGMTSHGQEKREQAERNYFRIVVSKEPVCSMDVGYRITGVEFSPDSQTVATVGLGMPDDWVSGEIEHRRHNRVVLWEAKTGKLKHELDGSIDFRCFSFHPDGKTIAAGRDAGIVRIWRTGTGKEHGNLTAANGSSIESLAFDPKGEVLFAANGRLGKWRWNEDPSKSRLEEVDDAKDLTFFVSCPKAGQALYSAGPNQLVKRNPTGKIIGRVERAHDDGNRQLDTSPDGDWLATRSARAIRVWDSSLMAHFLLQVRAKQRLCFHPSLPVLAVSGPSTKFYSLRTFTVVGEHLGNEATCVAFAPNGALLATATLDMNLTIWRLTTEFSIHENK